MNNGNGNGDNPFGPPPMAGFGSPPPQVPPVAGFGSPPPQPWQQQQHNPFPPAAPPALVMTPQQAPQQAAVPYEQPMPTMSPMSPLPLQMQLMMMQMQQQQQQQVAPPEPDLMVEAAQAQFDSEEPFTEAQINLLMNTLNHENEQQATQANAIMTLSTSTNAY